MKCPCTIATRGVSICSAAKAPASAQFARRDVGSATRRSSRRRSSILVRVATRPGATTTTDKLRNEALTAAEALERSLALSGEREGELGSESSTLTSSIDVDAPSASTSASTSTISLADRRAPGDDDLASTWEHRAWVALTTSLLFALGSQGVEKCLSGVDGSGGGAASVALALGTAYLLSDLLTAIYHWSVDNYGDGSTPLVGGQIAAFQGHHQKPWTITQREFANNLHKVFAPFAPIAAAILFSTNVPAPWSSAGDSALLCTSGFGDVLTAATIFLGCMSQQFHAWSHMKKSKLPSIVVSLQDAGVLVSRKAHGAHHRAPFEGNYAIVSGLWNPILDKGAIGVDSDGNETETKEGKGFFRVLERVVFAATGVEPRCWSEPNYDWIDESGLFNDEDSD